MSHENESYPGEESAVAAVELTLPSAPRATSPEVADRRITLKRLRQWAGLASVSDDEVGMLQATFEEASGEVINVPNVLVQFVTALERMPGIDEQEKLRRLVDASFGPGIDSVRDQLVAKFETYNGRDLTAQEIDSAVSEFSEVFEHGDGDVLSIDLGAFALFGQSASIEQNIAVQRAQENIINDFEQKYGIKILKQRAGDCYVVFIPRIYSGEGKSEEYNVQRMLVLTQELAKAMGQIEMPVDAIKNAVGKDGQPLYELRPLMRDGVPVLEGGQPVMQAFFKVTLAVADAASGNVQHSVSVGSMKGGQGLFRLRGKTLADILTIENKKGVSKGHARFDEVSLARIRRHFSDLNIVDGEIDLMGDDIQFTAERGFSLADDREEMGLLEPFPTGPVSNAELLAALVSLQATTLTGASKRFAQRCAQTEHNDALSSEPGRIALGIQVGSAQEEAQNPKKYDDFYDDLVVLASEPRFTNRFQMVKHDESWVILSSRGNEASLDLSNEQDLKLLLVFQIALGSLLKKHGLTAKVASSAGSSRFSIPSPGVVAEDWYWEDVVNLARLLKGTDFEGILVHSNVCLKATGTLGFLEFLSQEFKGIGLVQFLRLYPEMEVDDVLNQIMSQALLGVDDIMDRLEARLNLPLGHGIVSLIGPAHDPNGRYGKSALLRRFALGQKQMIGPKLQPVMLSGVNTLGAILNAIGYEFEGPVVVAYEKMLRENPEMLNGHLLLCDPSVELDTTTKDLLLRTGDVIKERNALLIWAGVEEGEVLRLSPLSLDDATTLVARTKGISESDPTTIALLEAELRNLDPDLISRLTPPFVLHQLCAAIEIKRKEETSEVDSIILHRERLFSTGTGSSALETQAEALNLDTDVRGMYGVVASLRTAFPQAQVIALAMSTLGLSEVRAKYALARLIEVEWVNDESGVIHLANESHREGAMHLHTYDFQGASFAAAGLRYFPSSLPLDSMTAEEQFSELRLRLQAAVVDVERLRELTSVVALAYYKTGQIAEARSIYHQYFEKVDETMVPLGLDTKGIQFYLDAATVLRQGASALDHQVAIALLKSLIGYVGITELQRQKVFFALSRVINKGLDMSDELGQISSDLDEIPFVEERKAALLNHPMIQSLIAQREMCGKLKQLLLMFPSITNTEAWHLKSMNILLFDLTIGYLEARFLPYVAPVGRESYMKSLEQRVQKFKTEYLRLRDKGAATCAPEMFATATRLLGGFLLKMNKPEGRSYLETSRQAYMDLEVPDYKQANDVQTGLLKAREQELMQCIKADQIESNIDGARTATRENTSFILNEILSVIESLVAHREACKSSGDLENWSQAVRTLHNVYLVLLFTQSTIGQLTSHYESIARENVKEIQLLMEKSGGDPAKIQATVDECMRWIDLVS